LCILYRFLTIGTGIATATFLTWISFFGITDSDFWWHIKAGQLMWETGQLTQTDPFAYTREGLPYIARHEWLSQLVLFGTYTLGGPTGIVLLRILCTFLMFGTLLLIDRKRLWPNAILVMAAAIVIRQGLIERPQLFSNVMFAAMVTLGFWMLDQENNGVTLRCKYFCVWIRGFFRFASKAPHHDTEIFATKGIRLLIAITLLQLLWVNLHGGAAVMSLLVFGAICAQKTYDHWRNPLPTHYYLLFFVLTLALLLSPNHIHNITYLFSLFTENSSAIIREWNPSPWPEYLMETGPFWIIALVSLLLTRKHWIATGLILLVTGYLSRTASRHEALFLIAALGCTFYQLKHSAKWTSFVASRVMVRCFGITLFVFLLLFHFNLPYHSFLQRENHIGFTSHEPLKGAVYFLNKNFVHGKMFNSYGAGGYLLFSNKKVFVDGRNIDYGFDVLKDALLAREDPAIFRKLEEEYDFTYAVIEYESLDDQQEGSFDFSFLDQDPTWALVYLNDWSAVYLKRIPENMPIITEHDYTLITPAPFLRGTLLDNLAAGRVQQIRTELARLADADTQGIQGLITLAKLERNLGNLDTAHTLISRVKGRKPYAYEPYEVEASILASQGKWAEAAQTLEKVLKLTKYQSVKPNYAALADLWERAGNESKAQKLRKKMVK